MLKEKPNKVRMIDRIAMFMISVINNTPYVIGIASAQSIVESFHVNGSMRIVLAVNTVSGLFAFECDFDPGAALPVAGGSSDNMTSQIRNSTS
jgi:hypothetical protein